MWCMAFLFSYFIFLLEMIALPPACSAEHMLHVPLSHTLQPLSPKAIALSAVWKPQASSIRSSGLAQDGAHQKLCLALIASQ